MPLVLSIAHLLIVLVTLEVLALRPLRVPVVAFVEPAPAHDGAMALLFESLRVVGFELV